MECSLTSPGGLSSWSCSAPCRLRGPGFASCSVAPPHSMRAGSLQVFYSPQAGTRFSPKTHLFGFSEKPEVVNPGSTFLPGHNWLEPSSRCSRQLATVPTAPYCPLPGLLLCVPCLFPAYLGAHGPEVRVSSPQ